MPGNDGDIMSPDAPASMPEMFNTDSINNLGTDTSFPMASAPQHNIGE
jgi:hypothetical protein